MKIIQEFTLEVSVFAPSIKEQLENQSCYMSQSDYDRYEKIRHAIIMLGFHISTKAEVKRNWDRFYKKIAKDINKNIVSIRINDFTFDKMKDVYVIGSEFEDDRLESEYTYIIIAYENNEYPMLILERSKSTTEIK